MAELRSQPVMRRQGVGGRSLAVDRRWPLATRWRVPATALAIRRVQASAVGGRRSLAAAGLDGLQSFESSRGRGVAAMRGGGGARYG